MTFLDKNPAMYKAKEINNQFNVLKKKLFKMHLVMLYGMDANGKQGAMKLLGKKLCGHHKHSTLDRRPLPTGLFLHGHWGT